MSLDDEARGPDATRSETDSNNTSQEEGRSKRRRSRSRRRRRGKNQIDGGGTKAVSQQANLSKKAEKTAYSGNGLRAEETERAGSIREGLSAEAPRKPKPNRRRRPNSSPRVEKTNVRPSSLGRGVYSAIDLGTNNCRLLIARPTQNGFRVIDAFSRIVRLGEGIGETGRLSQGAMDRTIEALKVCSEKLARRNVTCMRHVATEACRVADNSDEFVARVKAETGINLDVITAGEEARLAVMGCQSLIAPNNQNALVFDIGGGSTELIWVRIRKGRASEIKGWMSIPWGVVNLSESFGTPHGTLSQDQYQRMVKTVCNHLYAFEEAHRLSEVLGKRRTQFLGTSGTVTTLASLHLQLPRYIRDKVDGAWMKTNDIKALSQKVARMSHAERSAQPCIGSERADLVVAGCAILDGILGMWEVPSLRVADRGIREGILRGLMQTEEPPVRADKAMKNIRVQSNG